MQRKAMSDLNRWKNNRSRKPLIVYGARQVGKTWLMKEFGAKYFESFVRFDLYENKRLAHIFDQDLSAKRIIKSLSIEAQEQILPGKTLIIIDELQQSNAAKLALKYFNEQAPEYFVVAAGSYLGLGSGSFPVGQVDRLTIYPMTFVEFLQAQGEESLVTIIQERDFVNLKIFKERLLDRLKEYFIVGGMPAVVSEYVKNQDFLTVKDRQRALLNDYKDDFANHQGGTDEAGAVLTAVDVAKMKLIWQAIPKNLAKSEEIKRFQYSLLKPGARGRDYKLPLFWLEDSGLIHKVNQVENPMLPLTNYQDTNLFKLFMLDIGLLSALSELDISTYNSPNYAIFSHFKGALAEQFALQELRANNPNLPIYFWTTDNSSGEVDFLIQSQNTIVPIEVKSGTNISAPSLNKYAKKYYPTKKVLASLNDYQSDGELLKIPLFMIGEITKMLENPKL